ncbi:FG-GAP repeat domain-containing protein [Sandaracinus amylolyticus]|uniref:FG-GAP repeat domain-containing protein n=1 Tax=Sandaracinus amylolyticus TaxID=927083 RepID=UPI001F2C51DF|nr:VCBS repeat-containing protein [Sandaracinus amylolyticus]UJR86334.1 Hypothetical protein I5071_84280 [Sandaracinus amylolyticus]
MRIGGGGSALFFACSFFLVATGCDCAGEGPGGPGAPCDIASDCRSDLACLDGTCQPRRDGAVPGDASSGGDGGSCADAPERQCRGGRVCCAEGEECVDGFVCAPVCENTRCGDNNLVCCAAGQICLDGVVCAASCEAGRALCGESLDTCCGEGEVCVEDACVTPGSTCADDYDCLDEGTYCEPTIGRCLANPAPPLCEVRPDFDDVELDVEWHWQGVEVGGRRYQNVGATPVVGDVSGDGVPDVVVAVYGVPVEGGGDPVNGDTVLVAIHGGTGALLWSVGPTDGPQPHSVAALANLDPSDDALEVVYKLRSSGLRVLDGDGTAELARITTGSAASSRSGPSIADMDHDGVPEIAAGCHVMSFERMGAGWTLRTRGDAGACGEPSQSFASPAVANLDGDPELELTTGGAAYGLDGTRLWPAAGTTPQHGLAAVADLDVDGDPEVISIRGGAITVRDGATGAVLVGAGGTWLAANVAIPGGGNGGAPTVADFDGDGLPEVATAGRGCYAVYDPDCLPDATRPRAGGDCTRPADDPASTCDDSPSAFLRSARVTQDVSSSVTGSSVFDFQGDGIAEVIYNDECFLHVYDGRDGRELLATPRPNSSRTILEYPLVVDVDRDGNSEIVLPANNDQGDRDGCLAQWVDALGVADVAALPPEFRNGSFGVFAFGDPNDRWVRTRPIWNQFAYHVTNVDDRGGIPTSEDDNWSVDGLNNYRQNVQGAGVFNAPNLTVALDAVALCGSSSIRLSAVITNAGSRGVPAGVPVEFVETAPTARTITTSATTRPLLPGASERITITVSDVPFDTDLAYEVRVDGATATDPVIECNEDDNASSAMDRCPGFG